jgi:MFS family permease
LLQEFGWSRASLSGAFSLYAFAYCVVGYPAGRLTDYWGPRAVIAAGGLFLGAALAGMAFVTELWHPYVLYGGLAALGMGTAYVPCNTTVVKWFVRRRGLAVGLAGSGGSMGTLVLPPLAQYLVSAVGWRTAYLIFGAGVFIALNVVARVMRRDPETLGLTPDGDSPAPAVVTGGGTGLGTALRTRAFWLLAATFTATWLPVFIPLVHIVPFVLDLGFSPLVAASMLSALGVGAVIGRLALGALSDRLGRRGALALAFGLQILAFLAYTGAESLPLLYTATLAFGFSYGAISTLFPAVVGDFFGREQAGEIVGFLFAIAGSMAAWGPLAAGALHDGTGSYAVSFVLGAVCNGVALLGLAVARPPEPA